MKQYLIPCHTLVSRYVSLNILSEKAFTVRECFSPHVRPVKNKDSNCCQSGKIQGVKGSCLRTVKLENK